MTKLHFATILTIFLSIYFGMHYFVFTSIANGLAVFGTARSALKLFFLIAACSFILTEFLTHKWSAAWLRPIANFGYIWLGTLSIALSLFLVADIAHIIMPGLVLRYNITVVTLILIAVASAYSLINVASGPVLKEIEIGTKKLPAGTNQLIIVQLSDMHIDMLTRPEWLRGLVTRTNEIKPDIILITGDLIDAAIYNGPVYCEILRSLKSKYGVFAVSGNHEFYVGMDIFIRTAKQSNIEIIDDKKVRVAGMVDLIGIDDELSAKGARAEKRISEILLCDPPQDAGIFSILLSHRPNTFDTAAKLGIDLQLSGHTHAGQIPPMDLIVQFAYKYPNGFYKNGSSYCYTTTGTGIWGPPMRLFPYLR